jgi:hypothetical protein
MSTLPTSLTYPAAETAKLEALDQLFQEWQQTALGMAPERSQQIKEMVFDGFYPHYFSKRPRLLFIGREARGLSGCNYLDCLGHAYRHSKRIGRQHLNRSPFHRRLLRIAHGLQTGLPPLHEIPAASRIGDSFATEAGVSFAFLNLSKFSNESSSWPSNWAYIQEAVRQATSEQRFVSRQIALLEPEIVITMNLRHYHWVLGEECPSLAGPQGPVSAWALTSQGHQSLLLDGFHLSAPRKRDLDDFYLPICSAVKTHYI